MKNGFTAERMNFCGEPGYMLTQYRNGEEVVKQFLDDLSYSDFCRAYNINPVIITKEK